MKSLKCHHWAVNIWRFTLKCYWCSTLVNWVRFVVGFWTILIWVTKKDKTCKLICGMVKRKTTLFQWFLLYKLHFILSMQHWVKKKHLRSSAFTQRNLNLNTSLSFHVTKVFIFCSFLLACEKKKIFFFWRRSFQIKLYQIIQLVSTALWNSVLLENNDYLQHIQCYSVHVSVMHSMQEVSWPFYYNTLSLSQPPS